MTAACLGPGHERFNKRCVRCIAVVVEELRVDFLCLGSVSGSFVVAAGRHQIIRRCGGRIVRSSSAAEELSGFGVVSLLRMEGGLPGRCARAQGLVWRQGTGGQRCPRASSESHEQGVISAGDRRVFRRVLTDSLERQGLSAATSQKDRSKRSPWV